MPTTGNSSWAVSGSFTGRGETLWEEHSPSLTVPKPCGQGEGLGVVPQGGAGSPGASLGCPGVVMMPGARHTAVIFSSLPELLRSRFLMYKIASSSEICHSSGSNLGTCTEALCLDKGGDTAVATRHSQGCWASPTFSVQGGTLRS